MTDDAVRLLREVRDLLGRIGWEVGGIRAGTTGIEDGIANINSRLDQVDERLEQLLRR